MRGCGLTLGFCAAKSKGEAMLPCGELVPPEKRRELSVTRYEEDGDGEVEEIGRRGEEGWKA